jgi:nickel/cobalt transporter (NiCoT) family protein
VLSLPILFAAGMSLFDTADGCFMNFAYDWAFSRPVRKVYYNLTITGLSVFVAMFIGAVEVLGLLSQDGHLTGPGWAWLADFDLNKAGFVIAGVFVLTWVVALAIWRFGKIEQRWDLAARDSGHRPGEPGEPESERVLARVPGGC